MANGNDDKTASGRAAAQLAPAAEPAKKADDDKAAAPAKKREADEDKSARRRNELEAQLVDHRATVARAHADHPTPPVKFGRMTREDKRRWNEKRRVLDAANRAYFTSVRAICERHGAEDLAAAREVV